MDRKKINFFIIFIMSKIIFGYSEPSTVKKYFPVPDLTVRTPSVMKSHGFTNQKEMLDYLGTIHHDGYHTIVDLLGPTDGKNYLPLFVIAKDKIFSKSKLTVMLVAQQHGDEPMSGDVLLGTINRLARGDLQYLLDRINVIVMPRINPDGSERFKRERKDGRDINADHTKLLTKEAYFMKQVFNKYKPDVFIDIHEFIADKYSYSEIIDGGAIPYHDLMFLMPTNLNYPEELKNYADKEVLKFVMKNMNQLGYKNYYYYNPFKKPDKGEPLTLYLASGTAGIARNAYGLSGTLSFLIELRGRGIGRENIKRRLESGVKSVEEFLKFCYMKKNNIKNILKKHTRPIRNEIYLAWRWKEKIEIFPILNTETGHKEEIEITKKTPIFHEHRVMPTAYVLNNDEKDVVNILKLHEIKVLEVTKEINIDVEKLIISKIEGKGVIVKGNMITKTILKGSYVIPMNQEKWALITTLLEPEGELGSILKRNNKNYPVYRYFGSI